MKSIRDREIKRGRVRTNASFDPLLYAALEVAAEDKKVARNSIIVAAVEEWLDRHGYTPPGWLE